MVIKARAVTLTQNLPDSALSRNTPQGLVVFREALEVFYGLGSDDEALGVLAKLNKALVGLEAHGHLPPEEFWWATELRNIEESEV